MKTRYTIYCVLIALAALSTPASAEMLGDVNNDGRITTEDSILTLRMATGSVAQEMDRADVNRDDTVNSLDARMIQTIAQKTQVYVNAPDIVSGTFEVTIDIHNAANLDSGQFDLSFDPGVVTVTAVHDGNIDGRPVPVESWDFVDADTIRVLFNLPGVGGVSGEGQIATISFEVTGSQGDTSVLDISNRELFDTEANEISALWNDCRVAIGASVTVNAPEVVTDVFEVAIDIENVTDLSCGQFDLTFDPGVVNTIDVDVGNIAGTTVPIVGWAFVDTDRIRVLFDLPGLGVISGSGSVARIDFSITGLEGDISILNMSDGLLVDGSSGEIPANWVCDWVLIGALTPTPPTQVRVHNIDTGENFSSIQAAIDDPDTLNGHVIEVGDGVCYENVKVTRSLTIRSLNGSANCVVQAAKSNDAVFDVTADYVTISGFTVKGAMGWHKAGVCINASYCNISSSNCSDNYCGISITGSNNVVSNNDCSSNNRDGISISDSSNNTLSNNNCSSNDVGGINLLNSSDTTVSNNILSNNSDGIFVEGSNNAIFNNTFHSNNLTGATIEGSDNIISNNTCSKNGDGLYLSGLNSAKNVISNNTIRSNNNNGIYFGQSSYNDFHLNNVYSNGCGVRPRSSTNLVYLNNFVNNSENVCSLMGSTIWNSSQKINYAYSGSSYTNYMGNHWSDYAGTDADNDGLGDTPYILCVNNDTRLLMKPFENYHFRLTLDVDVQEAHNLDTGKNFSSIQAAIDDPDTLDGHVIEVGDGVYHENLKVTKSLTIRSLNGSANCVIQSARRGEHAVLVTADCVNVSGFKVLGATSHKAGIYLNAGYCNVSDNNCSNNYVGIHLDCSGNNQVSSNNCTNNGGKGIHLDCSSNNIVSSNDCSDNSVGIYLDSSRNNIISSNNCPKNRDDGIYISGSSDNKLTGNIMFGGGIFIRGDSPSDYTHEIDETNMVNGKPVYYRNDVESGRIPDGAGQVILVNCKDVLIEDQELNNASIGVEVVFSSNITIENNNCSNNRHDGIYFSHSSNSAISGNNCSDNWVGIHFDCSSDNNISSNTCSNRQRGIDLDGSSNNNISGNNCLDNWDGIHLAGSSNNHLSNNNYTDNENGISIYGSSGNSMSNNTCSNNEEAGISLRGSTDNKLTGNIMFEGGIVIEGGSLSDYTHEIDETNTVNGKPVYYWKNVDGGRIPDGAGPVILVDCSNVLVEKQNLNDLDTGITVAFSSYLTLKNNNCSNNVNGISLYKSGNNIISDNNCSNNRNGIYLDESCNNNASGNDCSNNSNGISQYDSSNNHISSNNCSNNNGNGISIYGSSGNSILDNTCLNNEGADVCLGDSSDDKLTGNIMFGTGIAISGNSISCYMHEIDETNMVNGKPVYYWNAIESGRIPDGAGQVVLVNCRDVLVEDQELNNVNIGIDAVFSSHIVIRNNSCANNKYAGIRLYESCKNAVSGNNCSNTRGIYLDKSCNNVIFLNNFINNNDNVESCSSTNIWNSTSTINYTYEDLTFINYLGNYWDDYTGNDSDGDGIGNSPHNVDSDVDNCPLIAPFENYSALTDNMMIVDLNSPEIVYGRFDATIDAHHAIDLDSGQFDLTFNSSIVNVTGVNAGNINGTTVPIVCWRFIDADTIRVFFELSDAGGVDGSGYVARIDFATVGPQGYSCVLDISNGKLVDTGGVEISAVWIDCEVEAPIGVPVIVNAPPVVTGTFEVTIDIENVTDLDGGQFEFSFDPDVVAVEDVVAGSIGGTEIPVIWSFGDAGMIQVLFHLPGLRGVSGSGYVAKIGFAVKGSEGDNSILDISNGLLVDNRAETLPAIWIDSEITVGEHIPANRVHNINTGEDFSFIQAAIDDPDTSDGHIIEVEDGVYHETVMVTKSLTIRSLNGSANCVIQDAGGNHVVEITADHAGISGFTVTGRRVLGVICSEAGVYLGAHYCNISNNTCSNNDIGICLEDSCNSSISNNDCSNNRYGICLDGSSNNSISNNMGNSIYIDGSSNNRLTGNTMFDIGIFIRSASLINCTHEIDESNTVNGKPVYYWNCVESGRIPDGAGQVILVSCRDVLVEDQELSDVSVGVKVAFSSNITIRNNSCSNNWDCGIHFFYSSNSSISINDCSNNWAGIFLDGSSNNSISRNNCSNNRGGTIFVNGHSIHLDTCSNNRGDAIRLDGSSNNSISTNTCSNNSGDSICLRRSSNNKLTGNIMFEGGIFIEADSPIDYTHEIDETNTVNGKPVYYWNCVESGRIPDGAGQVILVNCRDVLVEDQELNGASVGMDVAFSSNVTIWNNNCSNNRHAGISLYDSRNNHISNNNFSNNWAGIHLAGSCNNVMWLNNFMNNAASIDSRFPATTNVWNSRSRLEYSYGGNTFTNYLGNYWSDYDGIDADGDGIGESPYNIDSYGYNYPLVMPIENYSVGTEVTT